MDAVQLAAAHYAQQVGLARRVSEEMLTAWTRMNPANLDRSWASIVNRLLALLTGGQLLAAQAADPYVTATLAAQGISPTAAGALAAEQLAGVASDGRDLLSLLYQPVIATKTAIGAGHAPADALTAGQVLLDLITRTQVADAGRVAAGTALVARPAVGGYVRMVVGRTCSRCIVLAGRKYGWNAGFLRHPRCDCVHIPAREDLAGDMRTDPDKVFGSMSAAEQDKAFGKAGADAIRNGANISQVVNARRGMYTAGGTDYTRTSTTRSGQTPGRARLMPEAIFKQAAGDRDEAIRLLRLHRYLLS